MPTARRGLLYLPGRQVLDLDRAELGDRMIGKTPVILDRAGRRVVSPSSSQSLMQDATV